MNNPTFQWSDASQILDGVYKTVDLKTQPEVKYQSYKKLTTQENTPNPQDTRQGIAGIAMGSIIAPGQIPVSQAPFVGFTKTYFQMQFRSDARIDFKTVKFLFEKARDANSFIKNIESDLLPKVANVKDSIEKTKDYLFQSMLANGFSTSFLFVPIGVQGSPTQIDTTTADGVQFWSENHLREDQGPNWSNVIRTTVPSPILSEEAIAAAHRIHSVKKDAVGLPFMSSLTTLVVVDGSLAHQTAKTIKATLDRGYFPGTTPGTSSTFHDAPRIPSFEIVALPPYGQQGMAQAEWGMFDLSMGREGYGFFHSIASEIETVDLPMQLNYDKIWSATCFATFYASDLRTAMWSKGDSTTA